VHNRREAETVEQFLRPMADAVVYMHDDQTVPVHRVAFAPGLLLAELKAFLAEVLRFNYDPDRSAMIVYKKDSYDMKPGNAVKDYREYGVSYDFASHSLSHIWVRFIPGMPESQVGQMQELRVDFGPINQLQTSRTVTFVPKDTPIEGIRARLVNVGFLQEAKDLQFFKVSESKIDRVMAPGDTLGYYENDLFVSVVPPVSGPGVLLRGGHFANEMNYWRGILSPFLVAVSETETVPEFLERVKAGLALPEAEVKKLKFFIGGQYASMTDDSALVKGDGRMAEFVRTAAIKGNLYLYVVHPSNTKSTSRYGEKAVKIYN
jgi:hypothetical protein